jgi:hypothetical protein
LGQAKTANIYPSGVEDRPMDTSRLIYRGNWWTES